MDNPNKLYRSQNKMLAGVCSGIAEYLEVDVSIVRLITAFAIIFAGLSLWAYIIMWIVIPERIY